MACTCQVHGEFFDLIDRMITRLYERGQDPSDTTVPSFHWKTFADIPASNKYNIDEVGSDTNKSRKKKVCGPNAMKIEMFMMHSDLCARRCADRLSAWHRK